ncbi:helix-turn-helix domain-containing protein [Halogeometricum limi]|uniref:Predicted DNA binding protein, contains HTH domain n=1 Tax=Halogeometricum limi TaxID=555875 RepID=A0A1I6G5Y5_9EURY|nr:helix-turn-helix domain-containing protein [Halogeometricum limi]SFR37595.1 Predicted DNA binding protein, contains HTH domain [Halogeometricum limi]
MSIIVDFRVPSSQFELGRILSMRARATVELEALVPLGEKAVPFFWVYDSDRPTFIETARAHDSVESITEIDTYENRVLVALDWHVADDAVFQSLLDTGGHILAATGSSETWEFECRFPGYEDLAAFNRACVDARVSIDVHRVYNPTKPDAGPWYGLTPRQRETLLLAVEEGYYDIPRRITTVELADELGISDQAVTERLRRAIVTLVTNSLQTIETE